jgi:hypothetical protein
MGWRGTMEAEETFFPERVTDEWLESEIRLQEQTNRADMRTIYALRELQERRAAEREQAATEPRLAKWERRLDRMSGGLHFNYSGGEGWYASWMIDGGVVKYAYGDTPKAAVKAARRAWREARDER